MRLPVQGGSVSTHLSPLRGELRFAALHKLSRPGTIASSLVPSKESEAVNLADGGVTVGSRDVATSPLAKDSDTPHTHAYRKRAMASLKLEGSPLY